MTVPENIEPAHRAASVPQWRESRTGCNTRVRPIPHNPQRPWTSEQPMHSPSALSQYLFAETRQELISGPAQTSPLHHLKQSLGKLPHEQQFPHQLLQPERQTAPPLGAAHQQYTARYDLYVERLKTPPLLSRGFALRLWGSHYVFEY